ncbi:DUF1376 domain-containing protein [Erythrobacter arachoides]|uniref:DUF1376 domain-containing protein n=1 Tax=Aurantiacibacter arachoides TaxID=1850444 RepID=A0A844ZY98_9SPHN|nr:DUF1376 domain-containing protein [Aurantiacibacter arachoides]MXO93261.1 DUF1376 domain-containing protein [Aurantiacibacter arachoides]GGD50705.1 hypothetical protein GCM10011411_08230 [Aurantiacibacter arachoides]
MMGSAVDIWFPTYIGDFFTVTASMTGHEVGAFQLIIANLWKAGGAIKADDKQLAKLVRATPRQWAEIKETLWSLFEIKAGMLTHPATTAEIAKAKANREKKRLAGIASGVNRKAARVEQVFSRGSTNAEPRADEGEGEGEGPSQGSIHGDTQERDYPFRVIDGSGT